MTRWLVWLGLAWTLPVWAGSVGEVQIVDQRSGRELPLHRYEGRVYVAGQPGEEFGIAIRNRSDGDLLAVVSVDGVNVITGQTASTAQGGYVVAAGQSVDVKGWRKAMDRIAAFYFTDHRDAYATRTGRPENTGVIGVALFKRKRIELAVGINQISQADARSDRETGRSSAAPAAREAGAGAQVNKSEESSLGTGHGRSQTSHARYVAFERQSDTPDELITIEYDSRANLVARGVLAPVPREPRPFPAQFVQDPPC